MSEFKKQWDMQMAMAVLENTTIDAQTWSEAVKWLMLYGPAEIQNILKQASSIANNKHFPGIKPKGFNDAGEPLYDVKDIADALNISEEEAGRKLNEMEFEFDVQQLFNKDSTHKLQ